MTDEKLGPFSQTLPARALELIKFKERTTEAENRISAVEHTSEQVESLVQALEKQIQSMSDHIDDLENKGRRKNVRVTEFPDGVELVSHLAVNQQSSLRA